MTTRKSRHVREVDGRRERYCTRCQRWKPYCGEFFQPLRGTRKGSGFITVCRICIAAQNRARYTYSARRAKYIKIRVKRLGKLDALYVRRPVTWPMGRADRETIMDLHAATSTWPTHEEGRVWSGR